VPGHRCDPLRPPLAATGGRREPITGTARETTRLRERLARTQEQLRRVRATERVLVEQVAYLDEVTADAETRKLVAQTPLADREWRDARTDLDRHTALLDETRREAAELLAEQDRLLDRLFELETPLGRDDT
jgi:chromosome segregation ATPase